MTSANYVHFCPGKMTFSSTGSWKDVLEGDFQ